MNHAKRLATLPALRPTECHWSYANQGSLPQMKHHRIEQMPPCGISAGFRPNCEYANNGGSGAT